MHFNDPPGSLRIMESTPRATVVQRIDCVTGTCD